MMDCVTRAYLNKLEADFNWLFRHNRLSLDSRAFLVENGYPRDDDSQGIEFSDAFIAIKSKTTKSGNSLKAPAQAIHEFGLVPKFLLPLESDMTFDDYHNPKRITPEIERLAKEFTKHFIINYEKVYPDHFEELYKEEMIVTAGYAWPDPINGEYPKVDYQPNHSFLGIHRPKHVIFDNYRDTIDGDFIKKLASDYNLLEYGYRIFISAEGAVKKNPLGAIGDIFIRLLKALKELLT